MKKILFATDFSTNAERAFLYALNLARNHGAKITLLHIYDVPSSSWDLPFSEVRQKIEKQVKIEAERKLAALVEKHTGSDEILSFEYLAMGNKSVVNGILEVIIKSEAGILVIGNKGASDVKKIIFGSTTEALLDLSLVPVLTVPDNIRQFKLKKIVFSSDYQKGDLRALNLAIQLLEPFEPEVHVIHVSPTDEIRHEEFLQYFKTQVDDLIQYPSIQFEILYSDNVAQSLLDFIQQNDIDLMIMLEKDRQGFLDHLLNPDLVKKMESQSGIPILSFGEKYLQSVPVGEKTIL